MYFGAVHSERSVVRAFNMARVEKEMVEKERKTEVKPEKQIKIHHKTCVNRKESK